MKHCFVFCIIWYMKLLEGKTLSKEILDSLESRIEKVKAALNRPPSLSIINYYDDSPSAIYVKIKMKVCARLGIKTTLINPGEDKGYPYFLKLLKSMEEDSSIDAIMIERPLPPGYEDMKTWDNFGIAKDVDALSSLNMGKLFIAKSMDEIEKGNFFVPCTALAVIKMIKKYSIDVKGLNIAVAGRSSIVGRPLAHMLTSMDATVTLCHSKTKDIVSIFKKSDMVISAVGKARWIKADMVGENAVLIDVGTNIDENGKMCGDIDFEDVKDKVDSITPVPGGVGPVTLACLLEGVVRAAENNLK
ncbi:MAG: bifunctional 5,10-methylenetetrahydrofolate dehydrogenase/5,10-methenyltetrahydrofolate cyclohydrolase [Elusimicrobiales bacterium]|nr:bifunctional 5,10-methylenetetrahydrofolate dehydrogenase/5,10-methenyltetrahydrofolate cyclohydrolase [Elusimicrobiales bacterium]